MKKIFFFKKKYKNKKIISKKIKFKKNFLLNDIKPLSS